VNILKGRLHDQHTDVLLIL
jgi:hypothetical protein